MEKVAVSVIIPVYNSEKYLDACLRSVERQSLREIEILCVDNASTDDSAAIINGYCSRDERFVYIRNECNRGQAYSRNVGLEKAQGTYICFVDSDDMMCDGALLDLYKHMEKENLDGILFNADVINEAGMKNSDTHMPLRPFSYFGVSNGKKVFSVLVEKGEYSAVVWRQFWRKNYLELYGIRFFEMGAPHEDCLFSFEALMAAERIKCVQTVYYRYRKHSESITASASPERVAGLFICFIEIMLRSRELLINMDMKTISSIYACLSRYQECINKMICTLLIQGNSLDIINLKTKFYEMVFQLFIKQRNGIIWNYALQELIERRNLFSKIIVYGCGTYGQQLMIKLDGLNMTDYVIAVTDKSTVKFEKHVYQIDELQEYSENSMVLIAVSEAYQKAIVNNLNRLGFKHYLCVI